MSTITTIDDYRSFIRSKSAPIPDGGFSPVYMPEILFGFQQELVETACAKGRSAIFADCGMGKTMMQIAFAENARRKTDKPVLILTPLAVAFQTTKEGEKMGIEIHHRRDGLKHGDGIVVTNYERLHHFNPGDFGGIVCDESSILKSFDGATRIAVTEFMRHIPYRLLCTATAAPNDYVELGTSSEALGVMERKHMLSRFFTHDGGETAKWTLKGHVRSGLFWQWVASWARALRKPSDLGYEDAGFDLPSLTVNDHRVSASVLPEGMLFELPAVGLAEQRDELKRTINERCEKAAELVNAHDRPAVAWCHLNAEGDLMAKLINGAVNVQGSDSEDAKEEAFRAFANGSVRVIVSKPTIAGFGLNWQHCSHMTFFPSHSYEQYYQSVRRCWRFGQKNPVTVDCITTDGQSRVLDNFRRKSEAADEMFASLTAMMRKELTAQKQNHHTTTPTVPSWLSSTK